jgi:hypothetical protein
LLAANQRVTRWRRLRPGECLGRARREEPGMDWGPHTTAWLVGGTLLLVGCLLVLRYGRTKRRRWLAVTVVAVLTAAVMLVQGWLLWPQATKERFVWLIGRQECAEASKILPEPQRWQVTGDGSVTVLAEDGTTATFPSDAMPFGEESSGSGVPYPGRSLDDRLNARYDFHIGTGTKATRLIECLAERGTVRLLHIGVIGNQDSTRKNRTPNPLRVHWRSATVETNDKGETRPGRLEGVTSTWPANVGTTTFGTREQPITVRITSVAPDRAAFLFTSYRTVNFPFPTPASATSLRQAQSPCPGPGSRSSGGGLAQCHLRRTESGPACPHYP